MTDAREQSPAAVAGPDAASLAASKSVRRRENVRFVAGVVNSLAIPLLTVAATVVGIDVGATARRLNRGVWQLSLIRREQGSGLGGLRVDADGTNGWAE